MKLLQFILGVIVTFTSIYCAIYLLFYGMAKSDGMILFLSAFFLGIAYFFPKMVELGNNEYLHKIVDKIYKLFYEDIS